MFIVAIQFFISSGEISELVLDEFFKGFYDYSSNSNAARFVDRVSARFACCGVENSTDWEYNKPYGVQSSIPESCCKHGYDGCNKTDPNQINNDGCAKTIIEWSNNHIYIFLALWLILIGLSFAFCFLLKTISDEVDTDDDADETIGGIRSMFNNSESENLMNSNKQLMNYQDSFSKCNLGKQTVQIGFPIVAAAQDQLCSTASLTNLNKLTKYSQIRYSKVRAAKQADTEDHVELMTCHQELNRDSYDEDSVGSDSTDQSTKPNCDKLDKKRQDRLERSALDKTEMNRSTSNKSIDKLVKTRSHKSIKRQSTKSSNNTKEQSNDSRSSTTNKSNPNYDPDYVAKLDYKCNRDYNSDTSSKQATSCNSSPSSDESQNKLIHPSKDKLHDDKLYYDKIKNKLIETYPSDDSYLSDDFNDVSTDYSGGQHMDGYVKDKHIRNRNQIDYSDESTDHEYNLKNKIDHLNKVLNRSKICSDCKSRFRTQLDKHKNKIGSQTNGRPNKKIRYLESSRR